MAEAVYEDRFQRTVFDAEKSLLTLEWLPSTKGMNYPQFQGGLFMLAGFALQKKPKRILIDSVSFLFKIPDMEGMFKWRGRDISPLYNQAGVEKFAFLFPPGTPTPPNSGEKWPGENFPTSSFTSREDALKWLIE